MNLHMDGIRRKAVIGTVGVLAAGGAFLALGPSAASGSVHASTVSLRYVSAQSSFQGRVGSDTADCKVGRKVTVFKKVGAGKVAVGSKDTNTKGFYRLHAPETAGTYYATIRKVTLPGYSNTVCGKATSRLRVIS
jgi:hypothetical protein